MASLPCEQALEGAGQRDWGKAKELLVLPGHRLGLQYLPRSVGETEAAETERGLEGENRNQWRRLGWLSISSWVSVAAKANPEPVAGKYVTMLSITALTLPSRLSLSDPPPHLPPRASL